jgi:hypothetical protein
MNSDTHKIFESYTLTDKEINPQGFKEGDTVMVQPFGVRRQIFIGTIKILTLYNPKFSNGEYVYSKPKLHVIVEFPNGSRSRCNNLKLLKKIEPIDDIKTASEIINL